MEPPRVVGDTVRCPFHYQEFNQKGRCVRTLHGEQGEAGSLLNLPLLEEGGFLWLPMSDDLFDNRGHLAMPLEQVEAARAAIHLPQGAGSWTNQSRQFPKAPGNPECHWPV